MRESVQKLKKSSIILQALREIFLHHLGNSFPGVLITVTHLYFYDKTRIGKVYISFMPSDQGENMIIDLNEQQSKIRGLLGQRLANKLRTIPMLRFYLDTSIDKAMRIERLLNGLESPSSSPKELIVLNKPKLD